jgi:glycosyltransferase involved in cell wall biosynthesis
MSYSPIRVMRVIPRYAPAWKFGGGVRFSCDLDAALAERGFAITVYTSDQIDGRQRASRLDDGFGRIRIRRFRNPSNRLASSAQWLCYHPIGLKRALADDAPRFDVIHVAESRGPHVRWAFAAARAARVPIVWSPLGGLADGVGIRRPYRRIHDLVYRTRTMVTEATCLIAQSAHEAGVLERLGAEPSRVRCIGLGIDARRFRELPLRGKFRTAIGIGPERPLVLFVGRFHPSKGLDVLVRAAAVAKRTMPNLALVFVGWDHGALGDIRRLASRLGLEDTLTIVPPMFESDSVQAYVDADLFAMAAPIYEETSLAAMEALAAGTPCVLTHQCAVPGLEAMAGGTVTTCHPDAVAAAMTALLADPGRRGHAFAARRVLLDSHSVDRMADAYASLFRFITLGSTIESETLEATAG